MMIKISRLCLLFLCLFLFQKGIAQELFKNPSYSASIQLEINELLLVAPFTPQQQVQLAAEFLKEDSLALSAKNQTALSQALVRRQQLKREHIRRILGPHFDSLYYNFTNKEIARIFLTEQLRRLNEVKLLTAAQRKSIEQMFWSKWKAGEGLDGSLLLSMSRSHLDSTYFSSLFHAGIEASARKSLLKFPSDVHSDTSILAWVRPLVYEQEKQKQLMSLIYADFFQEKLIALQTVEDQFYPHIDSILLLKGQPLYVSLYSEAILHRQLLGLTLNQLKSLTNAHITDFLTRKKPYRLSSNKSTSLQPKPAIAVLSNLLNEQQLTKLLSNHYHKVSVEQARKRWALVKGYNIPMRLDSTLVLKLLTKYEEERQVIGARYAGQEVMKETAIRQLNDEKPRLLKQIDLALREQLRRDDIKNGSH